MAVLQVATEAAAVVAGEAAAVAAVATTDDKLSTIVHTCNFMSENNFLIAFS